MTRSSTLLNHKIKNKKLPRKILANRYISLGTSVHFSYFTKVWVRIGRWRRVKWKRIKQNNLTTTKFRTFNRISINAKTIANKSAQTHIHAHYKQAIFTPKNPTQRTAQWNEVLGEKKIQTKILKKVRQHKENPHTHIRQCKCFFLNR